MKIQPITIQQKTGLRLSVPPPKVIQPDTAYRRKPKHPAQRDELDDEDQKALHTT